MSLSPRAVAVLGIGFGAHSVARLGLWPEIGAIIGIDGGTIVSFARLGDRMVAWPVASPMIVTTSLPAAPEPALTARPRRAPALAVAARPVGGDPVLAAWPRQDAIIVTAPMPGNEEPALTAWPRRGPVVVAAAPAGAEPSLTAMPRRAPRITTGPRHRYLIAAKTLH